MAKIGEGDPRWLVEDREDGKNCNNWHWTEQDVTAWAKSRMEELFKDLALVNTASAKANLSGVEKIDGEVSVNTRKGKIFFFFELEIKLNWKGHLIVDGKESEEVKGLVHLPGISEENEDDFQINVSVEGAGKQNEQLKELVRTNTSAIRQKFAQFLKELRENKAPKLPPKKDSQILKSNSGTKAAPSENANANNNPSTGKAYNVPTKTLKMTIEFRAPAAQLYETLTNSGMVSAFTQSRAVISKEIGSEFVLFDGNITGKQIDLEQNKKIVQDWRFNSWPSGHFSRVTITFEEKSSGETTLKLSQTGVPESDAERTELGWKNFFWDRVKLLFGLEYKLV